MPDVVLIEGVGVVSRPWETASYGVVSLFSMMKFYAELFFKTTKELFCTEAICHLEANKNPGQAMTVQLYAQAYAQVGSFVADCMTHSLPNAAQKCGRIHEEMERKGNSVTYAECGAWLKDLRERVEDELHTNYFLQLTTKESDLYEHPLKRWEPVVARFQKVRIDVEESSKCFALGRFAACLFHVLLVAEYGVIEVAKLFGVEGDKPGWGALDRLQKLHDKKHAEKTPSEQKYSPLLGKILPLMLSIKNEWRHKISHVDNKLEWIDTDFSPEVAERIVSATLGFMLSLASDLPRQEKSKS